MVNQHIVNKIQEHPMESSSLGKLKTVENQQNKDRGCSVAPSMTIHGNG